MDFGIKNIDNYTKDLGWVLKAIDQLEKEVQHEKWKFSKPIDYKTAFQQVVLHLKAKLKELIHKKGTTYLSQLLYNIDVSSSQVAKAIHQNSSADHEEILSELIFRRCLQKVLIKSYYKVLQKEEFSKGIGNNNCNFFD